jgi:hypothetical protein
MTSISTKSHIGKEDFELQTNINAPETFERRTSSSGILTLTKFPDIWDGTGKINVDTIAGDNLIIPLDHIDSVLFGTAIGSSFPTFFDINTTMTTSAVSSIQSIMGIRGIVTGPNPLGGSALDVRISVIPTVDAMAAYGLISSVTVDVPTGKTLDWINCLYAGITTQNGAGTVTYGAGLYVDSPLLGTLKPTNTVGIYIENQGGSGITNAFGLYVAAPTLASTINLSAWFGGAVAIGTTLMIGGATISTGAILELNTTTEAFIPPRVTTTQRDAIPSPTQGMLVYNSTTGVLNFHNGSVWGAV